MKSVSFRTLQTGAYGGSAATRPAAALVTDEASYQTLWAADVGAQSPPHVDFARESVVFLRAGWKPTGGYAIVPQSVTVDGDTARVRAELKGPPAGAIVTQVLTSPFAVIAIAKPKLGHVEWVDVEGRPVSGDRRKR